VSTSEIIVIVAVAAFAALLKSVTGMGYPLVLVPALALFIDITEAIVLVAPSNLVLNAQMSWGARAERNNARTLRPFLAGGVVGSVIGALLLPVLPDRLLRLLLVGIIVLFLANRLRRKQRTESSDSSPAQNDSLAPIVGGIAGVFQGAAGISGPVVTPWFLSRRISVDAFVFAITFTFALTGAVQLVVIAVGAQFGSQLLLGLALIPIVLLVVPLGSALRRRMKTSAFENLVLLILAAAAISLVVRML